MNSDPFAALYGRLNWDAPGGPLRCAACADLANRPVAGAYPSALVHYEEILGPLLEARTAARILFVLQDPRAGEGNFKTAPPTTPGTQLAADEHRYFCLTPLAWRALKLDRATGCAIPQWPTAATAHHFLRRYLSSRGAWSYDGFLAYFIYLFRPSEAGVTDLAKCHFGSDQGRSIYERCAKTHLAFEVDALKPNLIISFTSWLNNRSLVQGHVPAIASIPKLTLFHPAARENRAARESRFLEEVRNAGAALQGLGINAGALAATWRADVRRART